MPPADASAKAKLKLNERERLEVEVLETKIKETTPARGSQLSEAASFDVFPLSQATMTGLAKCGFTKPTMIQTGALPHALAGRDILAAAKTGSGKTLAFLIPLLEKLFRARWDIEDGLGALVISPTRELALQIFEVLRSVGKAHTFSAGLVIGGKNFKEEQYRLIRMNILVCTPGRLLQHMEQTPQFDATNLQLLVLDEADRILDMGFRDQLTSIVSYLPTERQTMLFSATQTKSVKDLAKLSLNEPEYIAVHEKSTVATPAGLQQSYVVCPLDQKIDVLHAFIKSHLKAKTIVFLATCRQVRYIYSLFCKLQPGVPLVALHGKYKQGKRVEVYYEFLNKPAAVLFATDIAARGLDFPQVDWVVQLDCPEDTANYIHRVGRTARYNKQGKALMTLLPSEAVAMKQHLDEAKIPIKETKINPSKTQSCRQRVTSAVAADKDLKALAQKAFMSYVRSVFLMPMKDVFDASQLPLQEFAQSYGLPGAPRMPFLEQLQQAGEGDREKLREELRGKKNVNRKLAMLKEKIKAEKAKKKLERELASMKKDKQAAKEDVKEKEEEEEEEEEDDLMVVKQRHAWDKQEEEEIEDLDLDEERRKKKDKKRKIRIDSEPLNKTKVVFDDEGNAMNVLERLSVKPSVEEDFEDVEAQSAAFAAQVAARLKAKDAEDRRLEKERVRAKHTKKRLKLKGERNADDEEEDEGVRLEGASDDDLEEEEDGDDEEMESATEESDDDSDSEDEEDEEDEDEESEDDGRAAKRRKADLSAVLSQEELALRLLQKKR